MLRNFQTEGGSLTSVAKDFHKSAYIFHYTYGIEYTLKGKPQGVNQIGEWSLDKRHYGSDYPPKNLEPPPEGANALAYWLLDAWNEASANIESWPLSKSMGTIGWRRERITPVQLKASTTALPSMQVLITAPCLPLPTGATGSLGRREAGTSGRSGHEDLAGPLMIASLIRYMGRSGPGAARKASNSAQGVHSALRGAMAIGAWRISKGIPQMQGRMVSRTASTGASTASLRTSRMPTTT